MSKETSIWNSDLFQKGNLSHETRMKILQSLQIQNYTREMKEQLLDRKLRDFKIKVFLEEYLKTSDYQAFNF